MTRSCFPASAKVGRHPLDGRADKRAAAQEQPRVGAEAELGPDRPADHTRAGKGTALAAHEDGAAAHAVADTVAGVALDDDEAAGHAELVARG